MSDRATISPRRTEVAQGDFRVRLEMFDGPMDLLLFLVKRAEVAIEDIPIHRITDDYLAVLRHAGDIDVDEAGEFLVTASMLVEIKSRSLAPRPESLDAGDDERAPAPDETDPRAELVRQLLAYQRYRVAADRLEAGRLEFERRRECRAAMRRDDEDTSERELELEDAHPLDLAEAWEAIARAVDFDRLGDHRVEIDDMPIALHQADLVDRLERSGARRLTLQEAFAGAPLVHRVGMFLATLELVRSRRVDVIQDDIDAPIELVLRDEVEAEPAPAAPPATEADTARAEADA